MSSPQEFFHSIPFVTRYHLAGCLATTLLFATGTASPRAFIMDWHLLVMKFQIWRLVSNQLILGSGFSFIIRMIHLFKYGGELERGAFRDNPVEYSFMLFVGMLVQCVFSYFLSLPVLSFATVHMVMYLWARNNHTAVVSLMGVLNLRAPYLPWAFVVITLILGGDPLLDLLGIFAGHVYWFFTDVLPKTHGITLVKTPRFWYALWGEQPPAQGNAPRTTFFGGHDWGRGNQLHAE